MTGIQPTSVASQGLRRLRRQVVEVLNGALAGFRLIAEQPHAVVAWGVLWFAGFSVSALLLTLSRPLRGARGDYSTLAEKLGPFAVLIIALFLLIWALNTVAVFRAALQPDRRRFFYLDFGADELRLAVMTGVATILVLVFGGVPAFLLLELFTPFIRFLPAQAKAIAVIGSTATIVVDCWICVRLSLIAVETFAEGRFHLSAYWPLTRGRFWYLLFVYFVCALVIAILLGAVVLPWRYIYALAMSIGQPSGMDPVRRIAILALAGFYTALVSAFWAVTTALVGGSQAHAYRLITGVHRRRMPGF
jgi:hypothetical protein